MRNPSTCVYATALEPRAGRRHVARAALWATVALIACGWASSSAQAGVHDCGWNIVRAKPLGSYLTVSSVRNMTCARAKREARRARLNFVVPSMRLSGWSCSHTYTAGAGGEDPMPEFRCVRGTRAFRATARP